MTSQTVESKKMNMKEIEEVIAHAVKKVGVKRETDISRYLPMASGGYMHHFTLKKMKTKQPHELRTLIEKFIINSDRPSMIAPKQRAARGTRKRRDQMAFTRNQLERMLHIARQAGDKEMIAVLSPKRSLATCKRELIGSIRHNRIDQDFWNAYVESVNAQQPIENSAPFTSSQK